MKKSILVFCAHSDDQIFGPGATLAKHAEQGEEVNTIILSYGERSHPHFKREFTVEMRVKESQQANSVICGNEVIFYGLGESHFLDDFKKKKLEKNLIKFIKQKKPYRIFTHTDEDPHPDHRACCKILLDTLDKMKYKCDVFGFDVWGLNIKKTKLPKMFVDVKKTFSKKIDALKCFPSQWISMISLLWSVYLRAIIAGLKARTLFAERFYKIR